MKLTGYARQELPGKALYLTTGEWYELVAFEEVEDTLAKEIGDDADVVPKVEAVAKMNTFVAIVSVVVRKRLENSKLYS